MHVPPVQERTGDDRDDDRVRTVYNGEDPEDGKTEGTLAYKDLGNGRRVYVTSLTFGRAALHVGDISDPCGYQDKW